MPPRKRKPQAPVAADQTPPARVFAYNQLIHAPSGSTSIPGPDTAAVMAALHAGFRPNGAAYVERLEDRGTATLVVWSVPVKAA